MAISKVVSGPQAALDGVADDMTLMLGGFGLCGIPEQCIAELVRRGVRGVTCISNNAGVDDFGLGLLLQQRQIAALRCVEKLFACRHAREANDCAVCASSLRCGSCRNKKVV